MADDDDKAEEGVIPDGLPPHEVEGTGGAIPDDTEAGLRAMALLARRRLASERDDMDERIKPLADAAAKASLQQSLAESARSYLFSIPANANSSHQPPAEKTSVEVGKGTRDDVAAGVIGALVAAPLCDASWHAIVAEAEYMRGVVGLLFGLPIGIGGVTFHWWKDKFDWRHWIGRTAAYWSPVLVLLVMVYMLGPEIYLRATAPVLPPAATGFTQQQLEEKIAEAIQPYKAQLDQANKQIADAVSKAAPAVPQVAQSDVPISVERLPTSLRLLFKPGGAIEEMEAKNIATWQQVFVAHQGAALFNPVLPITAILMIFKRPIAYKAVFFDGHGAIATPTATTKNPRYAIVEFDTLYLNGLVDLSASNSERGK